MTGNNVTDGLLCRIDGGLEPRHQWLVTLIEIDVPVVDAKETTRLVDAPCGYISATKNRRS
jgi:hypothetical protein